MAQATVGINFVVTQGANGLQRLTVDAKGLAQAMQSTLAITRQFNHESLGFASFAVGIKEITSSFTALQGVVNTLSAEHTQFSTAMKAAIFSALVKPSSEATKMAAEMGIHNDKHTRVGPDDRADIQGTINALKKRSGEKENPALDGGGDEERSGVFRVWMLLCLGEKREAFSFPH